MYNVKVVKESHSPGGDGTRKEQLHPCTHLQKTFHPAEHKVVVELMPSGTTIVLPDDGDVVYIMDSGGKTVDSVRYDEALFQPPPGSPDDEDLTKLNFDKVRPVPKPSDQASSRPTPEEKLLNEIFDDDGNIRRPRKEFRA